MFYLHGLHDTMEGGLSYSFICPRFSLLERDSIIQRLGVHPHSLRFPLASMEGVERSTWSHGGRGVPPPLGVDARARARRRGKGEGRGSMQVKRAFALFYFFVHALEYVE